MNKKNKKNHICIYNLNEEDPISFTPIRDIPADKRFICTCPLTANVYAYDAVEWARYLASNSGTMRLHPVTQLPISYEVLQKCYTAARNHLSFTTRKVWESNLLHLIKVPGERNILRISTISPLYTFTFIGMNTTRYEDTHICAVKYQLQSGSIPIGRVRIVKLNIPENKQIQIYHPGIV